MQDGVHLVNDKYMPDCILEGIVARPGQKIYHMEGYADYLAQSDERTTKSFPTGTPTKSQESVEAPVATARQRKAASFVSPPSLRTEKSSNNFTVMKQTRVDFKTSAKRALVQESTSHGDELDEAIREVKAVHDLVSCA